MTNEHSRKKWARQMRREHLWGASSPGVATRDKVPPTRIGDACATDLRAAGRVSDPVDRLVILRDIAGRAAAALRDVEAATSQAVREALDVMTLDELSSRLNQSPDDVLFMTASFLAPTRGLGAREQTANDHDVNETPAP